MTEKAFVPEEGRFNGIAKPTRWNGIVFRSRLEARWAVFFDSLNPKLQYEYEPEQVQTPYGSYLPDFYLPTINTFWLVKGQHMNEREMSITNWLCERFGVFVAFGPIPQDFADMANERYPGSSTNINDNGEWVINPDCPMMFCQSWETGLYGVHWGGCWTRIDGLWDGDRNAGEPTPNVLRALDIARNHRFDRRD